MASVNPKTKVIAMNRPSVGQPFSPHRPLPKEDLWYKDAIFYELHVRAFFDSNGDGIGDFHGLIQRLDYLEDLGVTTLWLLPFYPSPLRDDGYDIADYTQVHPHYGTLADFKRFLKEAHRRGLKVVTELVLNHTSDQHPWFQRARRAKPGSTYRNFYVWSDRPDRYKEARVIFKDFEPSNWTWDPIAKAYYWHRFYSHQPDLNYENPQVRKAIFKITDFWLGLGVDGLRLDAVPYLFEAEGTICENLPETHRFLKALRRHVDARFPHRMLLAEANQWPEDACAYFGEGDECHMAFHFPLMPRLFMAIRMEDRFPILNILEQTPPIPENCQWALFLRNHDELTLEMVTDEDRDYMVRVYAQDPQARINLGIRRRLAPLLGNHRRKIELMNGLLFSLPGTPIIYYGDEIGMGDNIHLGDRNGVRTPMQWSSDRNAGFSRCNPQRLYLPVIIDPEYHYEAVNVEAQKDNPHSLLSQMKRWIAMRRQFKAFGWGSTEFLYPDNHGVLAFIRRYEQECLLVVANLSRFVQYAELDLSAFKGMQPIEVFGKTPFPPIGDHPYFIVLGPHSIYWFALESPKKRGQRIEIGEKQSLPILDVEAGWEELVVGKKRGALETVLPAYLNRMRWFGGKERQIREVKIVEAVKIPYPALKGSSITRAHSAYLTLLRVHYTQGEPEVYLLPLVGLPVESPDVSVSDAQTALVYARWRKADRSGYTYSLVSEGLSEKAFCLALGEAIGCRRRFQTAQGEIEGVLVSGLPREWKASGHSLEPNLLKTEQTNTSIVFGERWILKLFRRIEDGVNPEWEMGRFLTEKAAFPYVPKTVGALEYRFRTGDREPMTLGILQTFVSHARNAWDHTLGILARYLDDLLTASWNRPQLPQKSHIDLVGADVPPLAGERIGSYLEWARLLGKRTAQLHLALVASEDPRFAPEPFTDFVQRSVYQSMHSLAALTFQSLRHHLNRLNQKIRTKAQRVLDKEDAVRQTFRALLGCKPTGLRIRCHGDYHLGQVLYTGKDFVIIDFEGEPDHSLGARRLKRSPLKDVAGMLRSFAYAAEWTLLNHPAGATLSLDKRNQLTEWMQFWQTWVSVSFLQGYISEGKTADFLPKTQEELALFLKAHLLEKAIYELRYELQHRPDWVGIPLGGILEILEKF